MLIENHYKTRPDQSEASTFPMWYTLAVFKEVVNVEYIASAWYLLPPANEVWGKVMFLHLSVSHSVHSGRGSGRYASYWNAYLFYTGFGNPYIAKVDLD